MTDYFYPPDKFSTKDGLANDNPQKIILGQDFEDEFENIQPAVNSKLNLLNPDFSGTLTGGVIDGGTF